MSKHKDKEQVNDPASGAAAAAEAAEMPVPAVAALTPEQIEELRQKAAKAEEHWDRLLRTTADLENFKKRAARERTDAIRNANESLLQKLLPVLDNFEMALAASANEPASAQSLQTGIAMIHSQLKSALADAGLEEIEAAGKPFDPNFHEAVAQKETVEVPEGQVVQQMRKGYRFRERLLQPASVIVARPPAA